MNASTGEHKWTVHTGVGGKMGGVGAGMAAVADGIDGLATFYVGDRMSEIGGLIQHATFYAVDETGRVRWSFQIRDIGDYWATAIVALGRVFVGCGDSNVQAFNATTGAGLWAHRTMSGVLGSGTVIKM